MNNIFDRDKECKKRSLRINTFGVYPLTKILGLLEWVNNTTLLNDLLVKEFREK